MADRASAVVKRWRVWGRGLAGAEVRGQLLSDQIATVGGDVWLVRGRGGTTAKSRSPATPTADPRPQMIHLNLLFKILPSVFRWKCSDCWHTFSFRNKNFASGFEANRALFWRNNPKFILITKNSFQQYIMCLYLKLFTKKSHFSRQTVKLTVKVCLILRAGPTET